MNRLYLLVLSLLLTLSATAQLNNNSSYLDYSSQGEGWNLPASAAKLKLSDRYHPLIVDDSTRQKRICVGCGAEGCLLNTKIHASYDSRLSRFNGSPLQMSGFKLGLDVAKAFRFGMSGYWQRSKLDLDPIESPMGDTLRSFDFQYIAFFSEFILYQDFKWELSMPIAFGFGPRTYEYKLPGEKSALKKEESVLGLTTVSVDGHFRVVPWVALGAGFGYRHTFSDEKEVRDILNEPVYTFRVKFMLANFVKFLFFRPKLEAEREVYIKEREARRAARRK